MDKSGVIAVYRRQADAEVWAWAQECANSEGVSVSKFLVDSLRLRRAAEERDGRPLSVRGDAPAVSA